MGQVIESLGTDLPAPIMRKKQEMIQLGLTYGLANPKTIECSQQLDNLLNQFYFWGTLLEANIKYNKNEI